MLTKIEITNFKNFNKKFEFDLTNTKSFEFNTECVTQGIVNKALIYGHNGVGKSNLGFAIFDLISHLTDKNNGSSSYNNYLNANSSDTVAKFKFEFKFKEDTVKYEYTKTDKETLISENIIINDVDYASINRDNNSILTTSAKGTENLTKDLKDSKISIISYIEKNSLLEEDSNNSTFSKFLDFVNSMLFFRSLDTNRYIGLEQGSSGIENDIIKRGNLGNFESFLNDAGIDCKLEKIPNGDEFDLFFDFKNKLIPFYDIASQGTKSLILFYYWFQRLEENKVSFLFIDEFDAFYHHKLSAVIIKMLKKINTQVIITTHNTSIMTNELLRPDCYFLLKKDKIESLSSSTVKELRVAHNIEKMYKADSFV